MLQFELLKVRANCFTGTPDRYQCQAEAVVEIDVGDLLTGKR